MNWTDSSQKKLKWPVSSWKVYSMLSHQENENYFEISDIPVSMATIKKTSNMARQWRTPVDLPEVLISTHKAAHNHPKLQFQGNLHEACTWCTYGHTGKALYTQNKISKEVESASRKTGGPPLGDNTLLWQARVRIRTECAHRDLIPTPLALQAQLREVIRASAHLDKCPAHIPKGERRTRPAMVNRGSVQLHLPFTLTRKGDKARQPTAVPAQASRERENQGSYLPPYPHSLF